MSQRGVSAPPTAPSDTKESAGGSSFVGGEESSPASLVVTAVPPAQSDCLQGRGWRGGSAASVIVAMPRLRRPPGFLLHVHETVCSHHV